MEYTLCTVKCQPLLHNNLWVQVYILSPISTNDKLADKNVADLSLKKFKTLQNALKMRLRKLKGSTSKQQKNEKKFVHDSWADLSELIS